MSDMPIDIATRRKATGSQATSRSFERIAGTCDWGDRAETLLKAAKRKQDRAGMLDRSIRAYLNTFYKTNRIRFGNQVLTFKLKK